MKFDAPDLSKRLKTDRYPDENDNMVLTEKFLLKRGICCGLGCRHCPYTPRHEAGNSNVCDSLKPYSRSSTQFD